MNDDKLVHDHQYEQYLDEIDLWRRLDRAETELERYRESNRIILLLLTVAVIVLVVAAVAKEFLV